MAGHSKWANIRYRKAQQDGRKGLCFTKLIREISIVAKHGGGDPALNPRLRTLLEKATTFNMTRASVARAIQRGLGIGSEGQLEEILYEGYGPSGSAILVECLTDNTNRSVADVRYAFTKQGGRLATARAVSYLFKSQGIILLPNLYSELDVLEIACAAGAEEIETTDHHVVISAPPTEIYRVQSALEEHTISVLSTEVTWIPSLLVQLEPESLLKLKALLNRLEELDDVHAVFHNVDLLTEDLTTTV